MSINHGQCDITVGDSSGDCNEIETPQRKGEVSDFDELVFLGGVCLEDYDLPDEGTKKEILRQANRLKRGPRGETVPLRSRRAGNAVTMTVMRDPISDQEDAYARAKFLETIGPRL